MTCQTDMPQERGAGLPLRVIRVGAGQTLFVWTVSSCYAGCFTHWVDPRSLYCPDDATCKPCKANALQIWKGYAAVCWWNKETSKWIPAVLEISERLEHDLRDKWFRGQVWFLTRAEERSKKRKPVQGRISEMNVEPANLPAEFDVRPVLCNVFRRPDVRLGKENHLPLPQQMLPFEAPPPKALQKKEEKAATPEEVREMLARARAIFPSTNGHESKR